MKNVLGFVVVMGLVGAPVAVVQATDIEPVESAMVSNGVEVVVKTAKTEIDGDDLAVDELLKIAAFEEESLRIAAVEVMGEIANTRARAALGIVLYGNSMGTVRAAAADQLAKFQDGETVFTLALALETEKDHEVRDVIAANLEKCLSIDTDAASITVAKVVE